jgi:phosphoglycolate phosphatase
LPNTARLIEPGMLDLVVFDLDGTLVDSRADLAQSANAVLEQCGCPPLAEEAIGRMVGDGAATLVARAFAASGCPQPADALARFLSVYNGRLLANTRPYEGVEELLDRIDRSLALAVLTNKPLGPTLEILDGLGLARHFSRELIVGGDGPFPRKPDPSALRDLARRAGAEVSRTLMVGDSIIDWRTARAAGAQICMVRYGFGFHDFPVGELGAADWVVDAPSQLVARL